MRPLHFYINGVFVCSAGWSSRYELARPIWLLSAFSRGLKVLMGGAATGTDVPVERVELTPTRHPLGMLIKAKVLNICGNSHFFFSPQTDSASLRSAAPSSSPALFHIGLAWGVSGGALFLGHLIRQLSLKLLHPHPPPIHPPTPSLPSELRSFTQPTQVQLDSLCSFIPYSFPCTKKKQNHKTFKLLNVLCCMFVLGFFFLSLAMGEFQMRAKFLPESAHVHLKEGCGSSPLLSPIIISHKYA